MDFQNDLKTTDQQQSALQLAIEASALDLETCTNPDYLPQKRRLHVWNLANEGDYLFQKERYSDALNAYRRAQSYDCDEPSVLNHIGICLLKLGKIERAMSYFELLNRRTTSKSDKALALYNLSCCYRITESFNDVTLCLKKSLKFDYNEGVARELELMKEYTSTREYMKFKQNLFSKNVLPKEETYSKKKTTEPISDKIVENPTTQYREYRKKLFQDSNSDEEENNQNSRSIRAGG